MRISPSALTLDGFRKWVKSDEFPDQARATFLNREICLDMSKEEIQTHALVKAEISRVVMNLVRESKRGQVYLDGVLVTNEKAKVSTNPDGVFVSWETLETGLARLVPQESQKKRFLEIAGIPDWLLEVVSDRSVDKDTKQLRIAYHRARVPEYWLVDARKTQIAFQILQWRRKGYTAAANQDGWQFSLVFDQFFRLTRSATRMALWEYTLETRNR